MCQWNALSRESRCTSLAAFANVRVDALNLTVILLAGEIIHTENSYKYRPGQAEALLAEAGFVPGNLDRRAGMVRSVPGAGGVSARAGGAMFVSPALQRGVAD